MNSRQFVLRKTWQLAVCEAICAGATVGVYALISMYSTPVLLGALIGFVMAVGNFFLMAVAAETAADKALEGDVKAGKAIIKTSMSMRFLVMFALVLVLAKTGACDPIALVVPLLLARPILMVLEFFRKAGEKA